MPVSEEIYQQIALHDPEGRWELHCGKLRKKPDMSFEHNRLEARLFGWLFIQLDETQFEVRAFGRVRTISESYYIPDVYVVPAEAVREHRGDRSLEAYDIPLPLVIEIWSPSTGDYDVETKLVEYQRRGDLEIWRVHPYDRTITAWVRQPDGTYVETLHTSGVVRPAALPEVAIDLVALFA
jgi:Uma2 family endonuclease